MIHIKKILKKKFRIELLYDIANSTSGYLFRENKNTNSKPYMYPYINCSIIIIAKTWKQFYCTLMDEWIKKVQYMCVCIYIERRKSCH